MENHPIPQDVTGFKFKLIGSVTVKQFLYLLAFGILTTVSFILHINIIIKIPMMMFFAGIGASLAFVPIEGRPMDVMISNFVKRIPAENRYIYRKRGVALSNYEIFRVTIKPKMTIAAQNAQPTKKSVANDKHAALISRLRNSPMRPDADEIAKLSSIKSFFEEATTPLSSATQITQRPLESVQPKSAPQTIDADKPVESYSQNQTAPVAQGVDNLKLKLEMAKKQLLADQKNEALSSEIKELEERLAQAEQDRDALAKEVVSKQLDNAPVAERPQSAQSVAPQKTLAAGFPSLPDIGNVVMGKVSDARGKTLPNILVEILDTNNVPVRAFKTNSLGQFAAATPLSNGTYKVYFEDPQKQHEFKTVEIVLDGQIFNPIDMVSIDAREKLRRELFGGATA